MHPGDLKVKLWEYIGIISGLYRDYTASILGLYRELGIILGVHREYIGSILGLYGAYSTPKRLRLRTYLQKV